ncbi:peroxidase [candidate division KSB1 bacterium]|nr:peroxidase [candidate division KSB1 bacterium]
MPFINTIEPDDATGDLAEVYALVRHGRGSVANIYKLHSHDPELLRCHLDTYKATMFSTAGLTRLEREAMAVAVSSSNGCHY